MNVKIFVACAIVLQILAYSGCRKTENASVYADRYTVDTVDLNDVVVRTGEVQPLIKVDIKSEASGKIDSISVREGQKVTKGKRS